MFFSNTLVNHARYCLMQKMYAHMHFLTSPTYTHTCTRTKYGCIFNIHRSVLCNIFLWYNQQDAPVISNYLFLQNALHVLGGLSIHHQELKTAYTATVYVKQLLQPAAIGDEMELWMSSISSPVASGSSSCLTYIHLLCTQF